MINPVLLPQVGLTRTLVPISPEEQAAEHALLAQFATFWASAEGDLRATYDRFLADTPIAESARVMEVDSDGIRGWWIYPPNAPRDCAILYIHGGGYVNGSAAAFRGHASQLAARARIKTFVLEYPLAPEHPWPAADNCILQARRWLMTQGIDHLAIAGDSAGGGLALTALAVSVDAMAVPGLVAAVVFSPWTDLALSGESFNDPQVHDQLLAREYLADCVVKYLDGHDPRDPRVSALHGVPAGLPPIYIQVGTEELLLDDSLRYAAIATAQGAQVRLEVWQGMHHVFQSNVKQLASSRRAMDQAAGFLVGQLGPDLRNQ